MRYQMVYLRATNSRLRSLASFSPRCNENPYNHERLHSSIDYQTPYHEVVG